ncbi:efflux RND transporter periplasmic adaptor subunit [Cellulophaga sp. E16_2]|uniref:Secretion protein HlyD family protein n=1 Tax=Cellulophaga algicola (strain DSM 14237 / IC166 / ACAM 630) TaxID=688270 RepID=E6XF84_CELAD|nr:MULTISPECIES: HlyD family efflux transporter periplasmic adaptor subunit [Cellulophaga]ADV50320.1 secretion protein HlyD family protein [Cellulophaga algicola DSM 14237]MBO0592722.1 efflux RND transporter periplasmic adaptor subunit [Cellulophaga sp. E16_2]
MKIVSLVFILFLVSCGSKQEKTLPVVKKLTESVYASVTIEPDSLYEAHAVVNGILERNLIEEGAFVSKDTPLMHITNSSSELTAENALLSLQLSTSNYQGNSTVLKELNDDIKTAELTLRNDSINFKRQENLWNQNIGSKIEYDTRKLAYQRSVNQLKVLLNKFNRTKKELQTQAKLAQNTYKTSKINTDDYTITSKINGKVYALYKNAGENVTTMEPLASVGSATDFIIELLVDEVDIVKIEKGQKALISLDAYSSTVFEALVTKIYPQKDSRTQTFKVEALFINMPDKLYPGLSGEGNIVISEKNNALIIPKEYLVNGNTVLTEDGLVPVVIGLQNLNEAEVIKGIAADTEIIKPE